MTNNDVEVMAPDGDTILIVGAVKHKFRVSSKRLSETSSVFKALFGPHFREGQKERSASSPVEIDLPDDYWRSMRRIFNMLHGCPSTEQGSTWLSGEVLEFAISVDKYDLIGALRFGISAIFSRWFQDRSACPNIRVLGQIVAAAYLLEDSKAFGLGTRQIIRMSTDRVMNLHSEKCSEILPAFVFVSLEEQRILTRCDIGYDLFKLEKNLVCKSCAATDSGGKFLAKLCQKLGISCWPPNLDVPLQSVLDKANELFPKDQHIGCDHRHQYHSTRYQIECFLNSAKLRSEGLCLSCVYEERFDRTAICNQH